MTQGSEVGGKAPSEQFLASKAHKQHRHLHKAGEDCCEELDEDLEDETP